MTVELTKKMYLGDSVYAQVDELHRLVLTTENGYGPSNYIVLEPQVWMALDLYVKAMRAEEKGAKEEA